MKKAFRGKARGKGTAQIGVARKRSQVSLRYLESAQNFSAGDAFAIVMVERDKKKQSSSL